MADSLPLAMPYNRLIDGAGVSVLYGDNTLENHAFDLTPLPGCDHVVGENDLMNRILWFWARGNAPYPKAGLH